MAAFFVLLSGSTTGMLNGFVLLAVILLSVLAHELAHALAARAVGVPVQHIMLTWYGGYARFWVLQPSSRMQEIMIAVAGPLANLTLATLAFGLQQLFFTYNNVEMGGGYITVAFRDVSPLEYGVRALAWVNLGLGLFNLLPGLPLDGGHVLRSLLSFRIPRARAGSIAAWCGLWVGAITISAGFVQQSLWTVAIGVSLVLSAWGLLRDRTFT